MRWPTPNTLSNSLLPEHRAGTVPIFVVMDQQMNHVARFIETAGALVPDIDAMDAVIDQETAGMSEAEQRQARRGRRTSFRVERAQAWGEVILKEFGGLLTDALARSPPGSAFGRRDEVASRGLTPSTGKLF